MAEKNEFEPFVSVDIGNYSLKFAHVAKGEDGKPVLKALALLPIPQFVHMLKPEEKEKMSREDIEKDAISKLQKFLTKHLTELLYDNQIQTKRAVTLASGRPVTIRYIEVPPVPEPEALQASINAEATKQMPFSMENAVLGNTIVGNSVKDEKAMTQVMVGALQKDIVGIITDNLKGGGLSNEGILTLPQAFELGISHQIVPPQGQDTRVAVIHCGHKTTSILVYKNGVFNFYRDINMAGETITDAIFAGGEVDGAKVTFNTIDEAADLKHKIGVLPPDEIKNLKGPEKFAAEKVFSTVEKIFQHIQLSISFYVSQFGESGINKIVLSGGTATMKNFKEFIQESLEVPVEMAAPFKDLPVDKVNFPKERLENDTPALAAAVGISQYKGEARFINFMDILFPNRRKQSIDFSQVSSKFSGGIMQRLGISLELNEQKLRILAGLLGAFLLLLMAFPVVKINQDLTGVKADVVKMNQKLAELRSSNEEVTQLRSDKERLEKESGLPGELKKARFPISEMLLDLASATPSQIFITSAALTKNGETRSLKIQGQTDTSDRVFEYLKFLGAGSFFKRPTLESSEEVPIDEQKYFIRFSVNVEVQEPPPPAPPTPPQDGESESPEPPTENP